MEHKNTQLQLFEHLFEIFFLLSHSNVYTVICQKQYVIFDYLKHSLCEY